MIHSLRSLQPFFICLCVGLPVAFCQDGLQSIDGQHIQLVTDLESREQAQQLVDSFDAAVPQWQRFWNLSEGAIKDWKVRAHVMVDRNRFASQGLIPASVPRFPFGYALGNRLWVVAQPSEYYTRHLLLHEGVHSLAFDQFGGAGPSWFMEGTAELLSVHTGAGKQVRIKIPPTNRESVPDWGRYTVLNQSRRQNGIPGLTAVLNYPTDLKANVESYGWSWSATMLLDAYPEYHKSLLKLARNGSQSKAAFNLELRRLLQREWPILNARWRLMCHQLDYGFDWDRERVDLSVSDPLWKGAPFEIQIDSSKGWQSLGPRFGPGMKLSIDPSGQVTLAQQPKPWISEPPGVTIRYHRGRPLGQLIMVQVPNLTPNEAVLDDLIPQSIEQKTEINIRQHCWLLMRVNDFPGEYSDNSGSYQVRITR